MNSAANEQVGSEAGDIAQQEQSAMALQLHDELVRERAAHELTKRSLARAYDVIAAVRKATAPSGVGA